MVMIGNMTISSRPNNDDLNGDGFCTSCGNSCTEVAIDDSFGDSFGNVTCWSQGSDCCEAEVGEGKIFLDRTSFHTARKDHLNKDGSVQIAKGQRYKAKIRKGYYIDSDGDRCGIFDYFKYPIAAA